MRIAYVFVAVLSLVGSSQAQTPLEFSPYKIDVFIALEDPGDLSPIAQSQLTKRLVELSQAHVGAPWSIDVRFADGALLGELLSLEGDVTAGRLVELTPKSTRRDKAFYVHIRKELSLWQVRLCELDFRTFQRSPMGDESHLSESRLPEGLLNAMVDVFSPIVKLDIAQRDTISGTLQASGLAVEQDSPVLVDAGEPLLPVLRHNDRLGRSSVSDVLPIPWTVLEVLESEQHQLTCQIHSAHRNPLGGKSRLRLVRYAQAARHPAAEVRLELATPDGQPLVDYEIVQRNSATGEAIPLARTNGNGTALLPASTSPWQMLYVRHGERMLARLPIVSGASDAYNVQLASDDIRLAAEGFVAAFKQEIVDTVARRQILAARIRRRIAEGDFTQAEVLLEELRGLQGATAYARRLDEAQREYIAGNARSQQLIDEMFSNTRQVLERYLGVREIDALSQQLAAARAEG